MKESDIIFEAGKYWVFKEKKIFYVMKNGITASESIAAFDDYSLAHAYASYKEQN